tara:strand:- start:240 stop:632 length:393 start_codon:yes stop_codon:yes gene_type:complete
MASVDDIRRDEGYLQWDDEHNDVLVVTAMKRNRKRANYQMDLRYIESVVAESHGRGQFSVVVDLAGFRIWHLDWQLFRVLADGLQRRIKNKVKRVCIVNSTIPARFAQWMMSRRISDKVLAKVRYNVVYD